MKSNCYRFSRTAVALAAGVLLAFAPGAASAVETTFTGYTNGCFGGACVPPTTAGAQSATLMGLTYSNSTFDVTTAGGFVSIGATFASPNIDNLGSFTLTGLPSVYTGHSFDLRVTFTAPTGTSPNTVVFNDMLTGTVSGTNNGGVFVDFDNTVKHFTFAGGGTFDFFVNDVSLTAGQSIAVSGTITSQVSPIPEPETYALLMAGLGAVSFMARRRKKAA